MWNLTDCKFNQTQGGQRQIFFLNTEINLRRQFEMTVCNFLTVFVEEKTSFKHDSESIMYYHIYRSTIWIHTNKLYVQVLKETHTWSKWIHAVYIYTLFTLLTQRGRSYINNMSWRKQASCCRRCRPLCAACAFGCLGCEISKSSQGLNLMFNWATRFRFATLLASLI